MSKPVKIAFFGILGLAGLVLAIVVAGFITVQSDWFKNKVREQIVAVAENTTGGRVEIGKFNYDWRSLTAEVAPFIIHGREPASAPPFVRADKIRIGLKIISALKKQVDIASLIVEKPQIYVTVAPDGSTNVPTPKVPRSKQSFAEQLLDLKIRHFALRNGFAEYNSQRVPLDVQGSALEATLQYEPARPRYTGTISSHELQVSAPQLKHPLTFDLYTRLALERNSFQVLETSLSSEGASIELKGVVNDLSAPKAALEISLSLPVKNLKQAFGLPLEPTGEFSFLGSGSMEINPVQYKVQGKLTGRGLAYSYKDANIKNVIVEARLEATPTRINLRDLDVSALHGHFHGDAQLVDFKRLTLAGTAKGFSVQELAVLGQREAGELSGTVDGTVNLEAVLARGRLTGLKAESRLNITPGAKGVPLKGGIAINYDQNARKIQLGSSEIDLGSTHVVMSGTLGENLTVHVTTSDFNELLPIFPLFDQTPPEQLPVALHGGQLRFDGNISGPLSDLRITGKTDISHLILGQREFDHVTASVDINKSLANMNTFTIEQGKMRVDGQGRVGLRDWQLEEASSISALISLQGADLHELEAETGMKIPVTGTLLGTLQVTGTLDSPVLTGRVIVSNIAAYGEHFDRARADVIYTPTSLEVQNGELQSGPAIITGNGVYNHPANDWNDGSLRFEIAGNRIGVGQIKHIQDYRQGLGGEVDLKANGTAKVVKTTVTLTSLNGQLNLRNAVLDGRPYGNIQLTASTRLPVLSIDARVNSGGIQLRGSGEWRMEGDYPGEAHFQIPKVTFAALHDLTPGEHLRKDLPFDGFLQGEMTISGPLNRLDQMKADVTLSAVQLNAGPTAQPLGGLKLEDLVLKNAQPVRLEATLKSIDIRSADFVATNTTLSVAGRLALDTKNPWDLSVKGRISLSILQIFNPNLLASGGSVVDMTVRGPLTEPQIDGRLQLQNASLFLRDFPNGVDQANGLFLFDRNRATVENLSAVTGGGNVAFETGSFVGFRGAALVYSVRAKAQNVRYRSPDGLSVTMSGDVSLIGTSESSVLAGTVTVDRASFNPRTDVGSLLAATDKPVSLAAAPNQYLRGVQFDINIVSSRSLEVQTSLTRNIQAEADLRLRGTPELPMVLGNITVNSGEIEFFGNKYTINRGEVDFTNPAKIEPIIDMDLETHERGIVVDIRFAGPLNKLNFSYRSDPPLETNDIIALLAVGRTPSTTGALASTQTTQNTNYLATSSNSLLSQAIAPPSGRLQRFFGVSHIKIDPQLTDITAVPQARLTLEQQISTVVTVTYITNLAVTNQQIVRVQWDLNKQWSIVALRDENGAFSVDFQYRKRFN
ncbi:MAG TPA: translocation/assembly module TamB domain-containing protein [Bryobacteraceae bacterium]|nr:translocation/assembly module TamB domain-containing protein [Bryobacteraceae bacterium]